LFPLFDLDPVCGESAPVKLRYCGRCAREGEEFEIKFEREMEMEFSTVSVGFRGVMGWG
jgi:hypothetical protein